MTDQPDTTTRTDVELRIQNVLPADVHRAWGALAAVARDWVAPGQPAELRTYPSNVADVDVETVSDPDPAARAEE